MFISRRHVANEPDTEFLPACFAGRVQHRLGTRHPTSLKAYVWKINVLPKTKHRPPSIEHKLLVTRHPTLDAKRSNIVGLFVFKQICMFFFCFVFLQRILRYPLLLRTILKLLDGTSEEHHCLLGNTAFDRTGLARSLERLTSEREVAGSIPGAGPILRVFKITQK